MSDLRHGERPHRFGAPLEYVLLILSGLLLLLAFVVFALLPEQFTLSAYRVPVLSFLAALVVTAIGNIVVGFIQSGVSREAARVLASPIQELDSAVEKLRQIQVFYEVGVIGVFPNRSAAMRRFLVELQREDRTIEFVGTSLLGSLDPADDNEDKRALRQLLIQKRHNGVRIRALLMHPAYGEFRERVENRERAAVARDIQGTLRYLLLQNVEPEPAPSKGRAHAENVDGKFLQHEDVRLYPGVVTAYAIFTSRAMLINLSTLHGPVYDNCALIVEDRPDPNSIFKKFRANHFAEPWRSEKTVKVDQSLLQTLVGLDFSRNDCRFKEGAWPTTIPQDDGTPTPSNIRLHPTAAGDIAGRG